MSAAYLSIDTDYPGTVQVDEEGDLHVARPEPIAQDVNVYLRLTPADKLALAADLVESALEALPPSSPHRLAPKGLDGLGLAARLLRAAGVKMGAQ